MYCTLPPIFGYRRPEARVTVWLIAQVAECRRQEINSRKRLITVHFVSDYNSRFMVKVDREERTEVAPKCTGILVGRRRACAVNDR